MPSFFDMANFNRYACNFLGMPQKVTWSWVTPNFYLFLLHFPVQNHFSGQTVNLPSYNAQFETDLDHLHPPTPLCSNREKWSTK